MKDFTKKILLLLLLLALPVYASTWKQVSEKTYIDIENIERYKNKHNFDNAVIYSFWIKSLNDKSQFFLDDEKNYNKKVWYKMVKMLVNCSDKSLAAKSFAIYDIKGQAIDLYEASDYEIQWSSIIPETMGELYYNGICLP